MPQDITKGIKLLLVGADKMVTTITVDQAKTLLSAMTMCLSTCAIHGKSNVRARSR